MKTPVKLICAGLASIAIASGVYASLPPKTAGREYTVIPAKTPSCAVLAARETVSVENWHIEERLAVGLLPERAENTATQTAEAEPTRRYLGTFKITGYDTCAACCGKTDGITASGTQATVGRTCAASADLPFGTRLWIEGIGERVVEDRGGAITGNRIDVLCEDHPACYAITGTYDVYVLED